MRARVLVPLAAENGPDRFRLWDWLRPRWEALDHAVVEGVCSGPWRKGLALRHALECVPEGGVVIIADADVWPSERLDAAISAVEDGAPWVQPFDRLIRLNPKATERVLAGEPIEQFATDRSAFAERPYSQRTAGGLVVMRWETAWQVPMDPRFEGWGGEDSAWSWALETLVGRRVRLPGILWHLWHEPARRMNRALGSRENERLKRVYARARRKPAEMLSVIEDARA